MALYFPTLVASELGRARALFGAQRSAHESYAVILEEVDEFWDLVKMKPSKRPRGAMLEELVQIAATCQRAAEDLGLLDEEDSHV